MHNIACRRLAGGASSALLVAALATGGTAAVFAATSLAPSNTGLIQTAQARNSIDMVSVGGKYRVGKVHMSMDMHEHLKFRYGNGKTMTAKYKMNRALSNGATLLSIQEGIYTATPMNRYGISTERMPSTALILRPER